MGKKAVSPPQNSPDCLPFHDSLTCLPNRELFIDRMGRELARVRRHKSCFALMMLNLDEFDSIIETNGHETGDLVLRGVAKQISSSVRDVDTVARTGGDEFGVLLDGIKNKKQAEVVALKILRSISGLLKLEDGSHIKIGASVSIVLSPQDGQQVEQLLLSADQAMNAARKNGNGFIGFSNSLQTETKPIDLPPPVQELPLSGMHLGISIIDAQHQAMANFIQGIIDSLATGDKSIKLIKRVALLTELCQIHFQTEEDLMKRHNIPGLEEHHSDHIQQLNNLKTLFKDLNFNDKQFESVEEGIREWMMKHIREHDTELAAQLKNQGVT